MFLPVLGNSLKRLRMLKRIVLCLMSLLWPLFLLPLSALCAKTCLPTSDVCLLTSVFRYFRVHWNTSVLRPGSVTDTLCAKPSAMLSSACRPPWLPTPVPP